MEKAKKHFIISAILILGFVLWTVAIRLVDVQPIGPLGSSVGLAEINKFIHNLTGVHLKLYNITDWLGLVPICICMGFGVLGLIQWVKRKSICKVDFSILALGVFYIVTIALFLFFENFIINYRPILINGYLEASYPSSTTLLVTCVMPTAFIQLNKRIKNQMLKTITLLLIIVFIVFMVMSRLISGVHWFSDIVGGTLISAGLVALYRSVLFFGEN